MDVRFELKTNDSWSVDDAICEGIGPLDYWERLTYRLPKLSLITCTQQFFNGLGITTYLKPNTSTIYEGTYLHLPSQRHAQRDYNTTLCVGPTESYRLQRSNDPTCSRKQYAGGKTESAQNRSTQNTTRIQVCEGGTMFQPTCCWELYVFDIITGKATIWVVHLQACYFTVSNKYVSGNHG